jgi:site-specific recombinase XerD
LRILNLRKFFDDIYEWEWKDVPAPGLFTNKDFPQRDTYLPKPIPPEDDKILQKTLKSKNTLFSQALFILRKTGMRIGELIDLELNCLEKSDDGQYVLHVPLGKLHTQRIIPVDSETVDAIQRIIKLRGHFLPLPHPKTGQPTQFLLVRGHYWQRPSYSGLRAELVRAAAKAGIKQVSPHRLRHTYATELLRCGIALPALMKLLGHNDIDMTLNYADVSQMDVRKAYFTAVEKSNSMALASKSTDSGTISNPDYIFDGIHSLITKLRSIQQDSSDLTTRKKLLRLTDRLSRVYRDLEATLKG